MSGDDLGLLTDASVLPIPAQMFTLPVELQTLITNFLDCTDICNLRLSCRAAALGTADIFGRRYFKKRQFFIGEASLEALVGIASTPHLARRLTHLIIGLESFPRTMYDRYDDRLRYPDEAAAYNAFARGAVGQLALVSSGGARDLIELALSKLLSLARIELRDYDAPMRDGKSFQCWSSWGATTSRSVCSQPLHSAKPLYDYHASTNWASTVTQLVLAALGRSGNKAVRTIEINTRNKHFNISSAALVMPRTLERCVDSVLARLTTVKLNVEVTPPGPSIVAAGQGAERKTYIWEIANFLSKLQSLRHLRLNLKRDYWPNPILPERDLLIWLADAESDMGRPPVATTILGDSSSSRLRNLPRFDRPLESLELGRIGIPAKIVVALVNRFRKSLKHLALHRVTLLPPEDSPGRWNRNAGKFVNILDRLLKQLALFEDLDLQSVALSNITQHVFDGSNWEYTHTPFLKPSAVSDVVQPTTERTYRGDEWRTWADEISQGMVKFWPRDGFRFREDEDEDVNQVGSEEEDEEEGAEEEEEEGAGDEEEEGAGAENEEVDDDQVMAGI